MHTIYKIFDVKEVIYVGCTKDFLRRWAKHISDSRHPKTKKDVWLQERIQKNSTFYMLSIEQINDRKLAYAKERYWIQYYRSRNAPLFNLLPKRKK